MYCIVELSTHPKKKRNMLRDLSGKIRTFEKRAQTKNWIRNNEARFLGELQIVRMA
jgi:hypothetical protein